MQKERPMNEKEISEIRRRFRADKHNIAHIRGCYVNEKKEIISQFDQSMALLGQTETEQIIAPRGLYLFPHAGRTGGRDGGLCVRCGGGNEPCRHRQRAQAFPGLWE